MTLTFVTTKERRDLLRTTGTWRWEEFFKGGDVTHEEMLTREVEGANVSGLMPTVLVMLEDEVPVAMSAICLDDLEGRPELNPWLAGVYVDTPHRGKGYGARMIAELEALASREGIARLSLYTPNSASFYAKYGWTMVETFEKSGKAYSIMQKHLQAPTT
ncbi:MULTISPECIES: GNAT family N-acetyltransferase [unclassified Rhizobium]|uniref:GNAT family N-acetyltransferase n=1 Tax=unclassified Rhizobium TaxID=2613769 RepID=UPI001AD9FEF4|nr:MULTISPECIES: GNAT family N-acetyltransferase [unclassified Rhizobium]MBO9097314.1 GNAT family N-acetyltransferase [Rhizobium sp. L58/93]MBO9133834.1 GNAT family N-acetyltransferase [Rhizobium sp. B209b/85]MBO9183512.1 GNAT family N-acetyltransferase [Rhizobium sp. E27B/91]QXZ83842.1 GNAT family N-acetyltransferase [Rhizobium sp. K1/93]QXZ88646.1 GNAT family N-acetyltransferase [Rhizobium sp. K15/93]